MATSQLRIDSRTGEVEYYPNGGAASLPHRLIIEVTDEMQAQLNVGGPFRWEPNNLEEPEGPGKLVKMTADQPVPPITIDQMMPDKIKILKSYSSYGLRATLEAIRSHVESLEHRTHYVVRQTAASTVIYEWLTASSEK